MAFDPSFANSLLRRRQFSTPAAPPSSVQAPITKPVAANPLSWFTKTSVSPSISLPNTQGLLGGIISFFFYLSLIAFFIFIILVFVHFTIKPIFKFDVNEQGLINVSPQNDGQLVWQNSLADADDEAKLKNSLSCNYTLSLDILIKNQLAMSSAPRVLLYRAQKAVDFSPEKQSSDLFTMYPDTNIMIYIDPVKNDLNVVAVTMDNALALHPEGIPAIPNIPLETPFRITIVFQPTLMEVYMNGQLQATRVFTGRPKESTGNFFAPSEFVRKTGRVGNLQFWPRTLAPTEIRAIGPPLPGPEFFVVKV